MTNTLARRLGIAFVTALLATGCAADDLDDGPEGDPNVVDPQSDIDPESAGAVESVAAAEITASGQIDTEEAAFLTLINEYRAAHGVGALKISVALSHSAQGHSTDMANNNYFAHDSRNGAHFDSRIRNAGYTYNTTLGENIAAGYADAQHSFEQWRDACDPDASGHCTYAHRQNMLNADFKVIGIGRANNTSATYGWYWTTDFGGYTDAVFSYGRGTVLANGGFESAALGSAAWSSVRTRGGWYTNHAARSTSNPAAGTYQMTVNDSDPGTASVTQIALAAPGVAYTLAARSRRASGTGHQSLYLEFLNGSYTRLSAASVSASATSTWAAASVGRVAPSGTKYVRVFMYGPSASGTRSSFAFDSVTLTAQ